MGATTPAANVLTDRLLRSWLRCRRRAWLDRHGDPSDRRWTAHRNLQLDDQQRCFVALLPERPGHGEAACAAGAAGVVGLRLKGEGPSRGAPGGASAAVASGQGPEPLGRLRVPAGDGIGRAGG